MAKQKYEEAYCCKAICRAMILGKNKLLIRDSEEQSNGQAEVRKH